MENIPTRESIAAAINSPAVVAAVARRAIDIADRIRARKPGDVAPVPAGFPVEHDGQLRFDPRDFPWAAMPIMSVCLYQAARELGHRHEAAVCLANAAAKTALSFAERDVHPVDALRELDKLGSDTAQALVARVVMEMEPTTNEKPPV